MSENGNTKRVKSGSTLNVDEKIIIFIFSEARKMIIQQNLVENKQDSRQRLFNRQILLQKALANKTISW